MLLMLVLIMIAVTLTMLLRNCLQSLETTSLEVGANEDVGKDNDEEEYFSDEEIDEQVTSSGEESEPLDESLFQ